MPINQQKLAYLQAMGIQAWALRSATQPDIEIPQQSDNTDENSEEIGSDWHTLQQQVISCTACELHKSRTQTVFGTGNIQADWMIVGEAPGAEEDRQGEPFVGRAGQLLNAMLFSLGLQRGDVYIANVLKCRPPNNRDPLPEEVIQCEPYLKQQVMLVKPRIILAVGGVAAKNLLKSDKRIGELRGRQFEYADTGIPLVATYHPAYLLRSPREKRKVWQDLKFARQLIS